jgi:hypothetical protein
MYPDYLPIPKMQLTPMIQTFGGIFQPVVLNSFFGIYGGLDFKFTDRMLNYSQYTEAPHVLDAIFLDFSTDFSKSIYLQLKYFIQHKPQIHDTLVFIPNHPNYNRLDIAKFDNGLIGTHSPMLQPYRLKNIYYYNKSLFI